MSDDLKDAVERVKAKATRLETMAAVLRESGARKEAAERAQTAADLRAILALLSTREVIDSSSVQSTPGSTGAGCVSVPSERLRVWHSSWELNPAGNIGQALAEFTADTGVSYSWTIPPGSDRPLTFATASLTRVDPETPAPADVRDSAAPKKRSKSFQADQKPDQPSTGGE